MSADHFRYFFHEIYKFLTNKRFILNLLGIAVFLLLVLFVVFAWLRSYTHHGQKIELPNYVDQHISDAVEDAKARTFQIIVNDSVHIVGKAGGLIQNQNPQGGSLVKEDRKIYVTITKYTADQVDLGSLTFYGQEYAQIESQMRRRSVYTSVKARRFDGLAQNTVLEVWYNGQLVIDRNTKPSSLIVNKGDTLEFVVSSSQGGYGTVKRLVGNSVNTARFMLSGEGLEVEVSNPDAVSSAKINEAIIAAQDPAPNTKLPRGTSVKVTIRPNN